MKTYRIFSLPSHTFIDRASGVDYIRVTQPMKYLNGHVYKGVKFDVTVYDQRTDPSFDWRDVFRDNDAVFFNYTTNDVGYAIMGTLAQKYNRKLICDFDDDLWNILKDNAAYEIFTKESWGRKVTTAIASDVAHATATNSHLKNSIVFNTKKTADQVTVLPNYIDLSLYKHRSPFKDRGYYQALHFGSSSHFSSLYSEEFYQAIDRVMKEYPNFSFKSIGAFIPKYKHRWGARYSQGFGDTDFFKWLDKQPAEMDQSDFMLVPLTDNTYNRSKSSTKFLEASSYKIPGIWQRIRQYEEIVEHGKNGFLVTTEDEWYNSIVTMLTDAKLRKSMGEQAFKTAEKWDIRKHVDEYAEMLLKVLDVE